MSLTLSLTGNSSVLSAEYFPPLELSGNYVCGLIDFQTYNSIPNVDTDNNLFHIGDIIIEIPVGSYELEDIVNYVKKQLNGKMSIDIKANNNTLQCNVKSSEKIYFNKERSIGTLLGFSSRELASNILHTSDLPVNIIKVNAIRVECNIISGSYINHMKARTLHTFGLNIGPGYKLNETPRTIIYFPVTVKQIGSLTISLVDQDGNLVNFRGETITVRIHLKPE